MVDRLNGRTDDAATDDGVSRAESAPSDPVGTTDGDRMVQKSSSPAGTHWSTRRKPWSDRFPHAVKAAVYVPVSKPDEDQNKEITELCDGGGRKGWKVIVFRERRARAGTRPIFDRMMGRCRTHKLHVVLVQSLDCLARSLADLCDDLTWLHELGIRVIALSGGQDLDPMTEEGQSFLHDLKIVVKAGGNMSVRKVHARVAKAKSPGAQGGRPRRSFPRAQAHKLRKQGLSIRAIGTRMGVPASTVADALKIISLTKTK